MKDHLNISNDNEHYILRIVRLQTKSRDFNVEEIKFSRHTITGKIALLTTA